MDRSGARNQLGRRGEELAAEFLHKRGYTEIGRNIAFKQGEIDLLMEKEGILILVEVKTQTSSRFADPVWKVDQKKQAKLGLLARLIAARYPERNIRVDVVTVCWSAQGEVKITHLSNVLAA